MAQDRTRAAGQNGAKPSPLLRCDRMANDVNAAIKGVQAATLDPVPDGPSAETEPHELLSRNHPVLASRQLRNRPAQSTPSWFCPTIGQN
jgi:hypothetical protein